MFVVFFSIRPKNPHSFSTPCEGLFQESALCKAGSSTFLWQPAHDPCSTNIGGLYSQKPTNPWHLHGFEILSSVFLQMPGQLIEEIYGKPTASVLRYGTCVQKALVLVIIYKPYIERHQRPIWKIWMLPFERQKTYYISLYSKFVCIYT